ncbi:MAG: UDP-3-O-acyl-N-acetylglucosamine deacetylase [Deltaproteobacteria bacterium]|nr:UDP-3-O-acyl-N-acetylglucosamine deacetylase [Deltaproteobacteria bacterium]
MYKQHTIHTPVRCGSVGLHSGRKVNMTIYPSETDSGIRFRRRDVSGHNTIEAKLTNVSDTTLATTLGMNGTHVSTVEHLLSALFGMGIDNAVVEVDSFEVPIMDGSALPFVNLLKKAGIKEQEKPRKTVVITKPLSVTEGDVSAALHPAKDFQITYEIDFEHPAIGKQAFHMVFSRSAYEQEICRARTFGFLHQVEYLQAKGLALGGSLKNAIVLDEEKVINKEGLRVPDEFVRHKVLDAIGDLSLLGMPITGHFIGRKSGHRLNNLLLRELLKKGEHWTVVDMTNGKKESPDSFIESFHMEGPLHASASL